MQNRSVITHKQPNTSLCLKFNELAQHIGDASRYKRLISYREQLCDYRKEDSPLSSERKYRP